MIETLSTMGWLLMSIGALGVIGATIRDDRDALRFALSGAGARVPVPLPSHTHRVAPARRARFFSLSAPVPGLRAVA